MDSILDQIETLSTRIFLPDNTPCKTISINDIDLIAKNLKTSSRRIEIMALENKVMPERYIRNMKTFSFENQLKLLQMRVCIVGLGGLGGMVLENLIRIGIGHFKLIDGDVFEEHNLNRQLLSYAKERGNYKIDSAVNRIIEINPSVSITAFKEYLTENNSNHLINNCEVTVDCLDNIGTRFILEAESRRKKIPMVSAAIAGTTGYVTTIFPADKGLEVVFGKKADLVGTKGAESVLGCLSYSVSIIAALECNEVIKLALGKKTLQNRLLIMDTEDYTFEILTL